MEDEKCTSLHVRFGERFHCAGPSSPKPLIDIQGSPSLRMLSTIFPGMANFLFICGSDQLAEPACKMDAVSERQFEHLIDPDGPETINYCCYPHRLGSTKGGGRVC